MNKYQEALKFLKSDDVTAWGNDNIDLLKKHLEVIEELVEKATPKKPDYEGDIVYHRWSCPTCGTYYECDYGGVVYCPECSQKIDWSEEDE